MVGKATTLLTRNFKEILNQLLISIGCPILRPCHGPLLEVSALLLPHTLIPPSFSFYSLSSASSWVGVGSNWKKQDWERS